ncbi:alpha/beta fold hydrolase [Candidatus Peregrinibacteria bacterium]|nr:alpha/beta fold hydrolase [Candidatus Peregrinibacteria bacterium]
MKTAMIIHGSFGHPGENWFPWLKGKLEELGYKVLLPQFPTPENQSPESWFEVFEQYRNQIGEESILIGHSYGGAFLLRVLESLAVRVKLSVIVAGTAGVKPIKFYERDRSIVENGFDWTKIRAASENFLVFHSADDPYICIENGEKIAAGVGTKLQRFEHEGHFNGEAGYDKFELLLEMINSFKF